MSRLILETQKLSVGYDGRAIASDLNLRIAEGEIVSLFGRNGAGKTTTLLSLAGELLPLQGTVFFQGQCDNGPLFKRVRRGMAFINDERSLIFGLSARDNLRLRGGSVTRALDLFPELEVHLSKPVGLLSGGQQQMLTVARSLASQPTLLMADEMSLGLAPKVVARLFKALRLAADNGLAVLLVEQHVRQALAVSDRAYVLGQGRIQLEGDAATLRQRGDDISDAYLIGGAGRNV